MIGKIILLVIWKIVQDRTQRRRQDGVYDVV